MKNLTKKLLSLLLVLTLAISTLVPSFAYKANINEIVGFKANFSTNPYWLVSLTIDISNLYTGFAGENSLQYSMSDVKTLDGYFEPDNIFSLNNSNSTAALVENEDKVLRLNITVKDVLVANFSNKTTFVIKEGAFISADGKLSPEMTVSFQMNEFSRLQDRLKSELQGPLVIFYWFILPILAIVPYSIMYLFNK